MPIYDHQDQHAVRSPDLPSAAQRDNRFDEKLADELELLSAEAKFHGMTLTDFLELCQRTFNEMEVTVK